MSSQSRLLLIGLLLVSVCAAVYGPVCRYPFVRFDDEINVYRNPYLNPVTAPSIRHFWTSTEMGPNCRVYRPVVYTAYALLASNAGVKPYLSDGEGAGLDARPFHTFSLLVHLLNVVLVFALLRRLVRGDWPAALGALVFAVHPVQVEPVAWVTGLSDLLGAFFSLLALWEYGQFREQGRKHHYWLSLLCFAFALLSKPSAAILPLLAAAVYAQFGWNNLRWLAPWVVLSAGMVVFTHFAEPVTQASVTTPWLERPLLAADALWLTFEHVVWPVNLGVDYGHSPDSVLAEGTTLWLKFFGILAAAALVWRQRKKLPWLVAPSAFFVLALLPVLGLVPFRFQTFSTVADRYSYLALFGPALLAAEAAMRLRFPQRRLAAASAFAVLVLLGALTSRQIMTWKTTQALWTQALLVNPRSWLACYDLGGLLEAQGKPDQAHAEFQELRRLKPEYKQMNLP